MERILDCYFVVAIVERNEAIMLLFSIAFTIEYSRLVVR